MVGLGPLEKEFGWTRTDTSLVFTCAAVVFAIAFILAGRVQDKLGPFRVSLAGCLLLTVGFLLCAWTTSLTYLIDCFGVLVRIYWCYGTQLSVNASTTSDFWGTKNAGINYGILFTAWRVAGILGPRIGGALFDKYKNTRRRSTWPPVSRSSPSSASCWRSGPRSRPPPGWGRRSRTARKPGGRSSRLPSGPESVPGDTSTSARVLRAKSRVRAALPR